MMPAIPRSTTCETHEEPNKQKSWPTTTKSEIKDTLNRLEDFVLFEEQLAENVSSAENVMLETTRAGNIRGTSTNDTYLIDGALSVMLTAVYSSGRLSIKYFWPVISEAITIEAITKQLQSVEFRMRGTKSKNRVVVTDFCYSDRCST